MAAFKAHVKTVDMSEEMEADAIAIATTAIMEYSVEKEMASYVCCQPLAPAPLPTPCADATGRLRRSSVSLTRSTGEPQNPTSHTQTRKYCCGNSHVLPLVTRADLTRGAHRSPTWHVIIGTNYGSHVVHATKHRGV